MRNSTQQWWGQSGLSDVPIIRGLDPETEKEKFTISANAAMELVVPKVCRTRDAVGIPLQPSHVP